jgi:hypothetical protein
LTAGSAAWVNGQCILGTGSDNTAYAGNNKIKRITVTTGTGNVKAALPTKYDKLTSDNFSFSQVYIVPWRHGGWSGTAAGTVTLSYDSTTGTVSTGGTHSDGCENNYNAYPTIVCTYTE